MFEPDKMRDFLKKHGDQVVGAIEKGTAKAFKNLLTGLKNHGVFQPSSAHKLADNVPFGFGEKAKTINDIFGDKDHQLSMKVGDRRGDHLIDHLFHSPFLRAFRPFSRMLSHFDVVKNAQNFFQESWKMKQTKEAISRTHRHENSLDTLMKMYYAKGHGQGYMKTKEWKNAQGDVDKMLKVQLDWEDKYLKKVTDVNKKLIERRGLLNNMNAYEAEVKQARFKAGMGFFQSLTARLLEGAFVAILGQITTGYMEMRRRGQAGTQAAGNVPTAFGSQVALLRQGVFATNQDVAKNIGELGNRFGTVNVPQGLARQATYLTEHMKLSVEQAGRLNNIMYRTTGFNTKRATEMQNVAINMAYKNAYPVGTLMRDIADDSDAFARHAAQGVQEFAKGEMLTRRMGTNLKSMEGFADRLVGDFEGSLRMQAELQTYLPDMDFSKIMFASQFGSTGDVTEALQEQLKGRDISKMPRSFQLAIQRNLGLSFEEIQGLSRGTNQKPIQKSAETELDFKKALATSVMDFISAHAKMIFGFGLLTRAANAASAALFNVSLMGMLSGRMGAAGTAATLGVGTKALIGTGALATGAMMGYGQYTNAREAGHSKTASVAQGAATAGASAIGGWLLGKLAAKAVGAGAGALLGSIVPGAGTVVGGIAGGLAADWLIDKLFNSKPDTGAANVDAGVMHKGGMVGSPDSTQLVPALEFAGAPKYHKGLLPDEFPTILQKGEAVLTNRHQQLISNLLNTASSSQYFKTVNMGSRDTQNMVTNRMIEADPNAFSDRHAAVITNLASEAVRANDDMSVPKAQPVAKPVEQDQTVQVDNSNVEELLRQMISLLKQGQNIHIDGKKVGNTILSAFSRD
jgi:hypothetical protein